jgi:low density lipoprotein-related protein 2
MFISDGGRIVRAHMDGSLLREIAKDGIFKASGLAVDLPTKRLFWCDTSSHHIETSLYDGSRRSIVLRGKEWPDLCF